MNINTPSPLIQYQINSAVQACEGRISCGAGIDEAFTWLNEELTQIYNGEILYEYEEDQSIIDAQETFEKGINADLRSLL